MFSEHQQGVAWVIYILRIQCVQLETLIAIFKMILRMHVDNVIHCLDVFGILTDKSIEKYVKVFTSE